MAGARAPGCALRARTAAAQIVPFRKPWRNNGKKNAKFVKTNDIFQSICSVFWKAWWSQVWVGGSWSEP